MRFNSMSIFWGRPVKVRQKIWPAQA